MCSVNNGGMLAKDYVVELGSFFAVPELRYHSRFLRASQLQIPLLKNRLVA